MLADRYALPVSTASQAARDAYVAGADCILAGGAGAEQHLGAAMEDDSGFALAQIALARVLILKGEVGGARAAAARGRELAVQATPRERSHVNALALAIEGNATASLEATRAHIAEYPRDAMALAPATGVFGMIGFSGRQERETELYEYLTRLAPHYGGDWWFLSMLAFAACECGRLDEAARLVERSLEGNPRSAHAAHVKAHVLYEMGKAAEGLEFLERWMPDFAREGQMHCHLSWHIALFALALGRRERAWEAYRGGVHPGASWGPPLNVATDAPSFLWRAELAGEPRDPELWREACGYGLQRYPRAGVPFADVHVALACAAAGDFAACDARTRELRERLTAGKLAPGPVVPALAEGFKAYAMGDWSAAILAFEQALPETVRIGGSRAQRDLVEHTLLAAYLNAGRMADAKTRAWRVGRRPRIPVAGFAPH